MLKVAGLLLMVISGTGYGFYKSQELVNRQQALHQFLMLTVYLKGEIRHGNSSLSDAFLETGRRMPEPYKDFLKETAQMMKSRTGMSLEQLFLLHGKKYLSGLSVTEEMERFLALGRHLGHLDLPMQIKYLELYEREAEYSIDKLQAELPEKKKVCQSLGILGGLMLAVLFL